MPYLNKATFEFELDERKAETSKGFFYVDDLLAETIQILNLKGYRSHVCCESHFWDAGEVFLDILFYDAVDLPYLPVFKEKELLFENCRLKYYFCDYANVFEFTRAKTDVCEAILGWAESLPINPLPVL